MNSKPRYTVKGRVVYEREKHGFSEKDVARILAAFMDEWTMEAIPGVVSLAIAKRLRRGSMGFWEVMGWALGQITGVGEVLLDPGLVLVPDRSMSKAVWGLIDSLSAELRRRIVNHLRSTAALIEETI